jgi:hypothetical protein
MQHFHMLMYMLMPGLRILSRSMQFTTPWTATLHRREVVWVCRAAPEPQDDDEDEEDDDGDDDDED